WGLGLVSRVVTRYRWRYTLFRYALRHPFKVGGRGVVIGDNAGLAQGVEQLLAALPVPAHALLAVRLLRLPLGLRLLVGGDHRVGALVAVRPVDQHEELGQDSVD